MDAVSRREFMREKLTAFMGGDPRGFVRLQSPGPAPWVDFHPRGADRFLAEVDGTHLNAAEVRELPHLLQRGKRAGKVVFTAECSLDEAVGLAERVLCDLSPDGDECDAVSFELPYRDACDMCGRPLGFGEGHYELMYTEEALGFGIKIEVLERLVEDAVRETRAMHIVPPEEQGETLDLARRHGPVTPLLCPSCLRIVRQSPDL
jgi:hypothetical protein